MSKCTYGIVWLFVASVFASCGVIIEYFTRPCRLRKKNLLSLRSPAHDGFFHFVTWRYFIIEMDASITLWSVSIWPNIPVHCEGRIKCLKKRNKQQQQESNWYTATIQAKSEEKTYIKWNTCWYKKKKKKKRKNLVEILNTNCLYQYACRYELNNQCSSIGFSWQCDRIEKKKLRTHVTFKVTSRTSTRVETINRPRPICEFRTLSDILTWVKLPFGD